MDMLAVSAHRRPLVYLDSSIPKSYVKMKVMRNVVAQWQEKWCYGDNGRHLFSLIPTVRRFHWDFPPQLVQFLTGHGSFPAFLHQIGRLDTPDCVCGSLGDGFHYLFSCGVYTPSGLGLPSDVNQEMWLRKLPSNRLLIRM